MQDDTIAAIATPVGEGGIGIVRISGGDALRVACRSFRTPRGRLEPEELVSHTVTYGWVTDPLTGRDVDEGLLVAMRGPRSYTREDVAEISCHGGIVAVRKTLEAVLSAGARLAEPGEFTRRAFLNGRIDLAQAEAVIDLIRARTDGMMSAAASQLEGHLSRKVKALSGRVLQLLGHVEARIDFPEDEVPELSGGDMAGQLAELVGELERLLEGARSGRVLREGLRTVIVGRPNVGKSSLLNALLREKRALVTEVPGTTRDVIEEWLNLQGFPVVLVDTAGIRESDDLVERLGVERTRESLARAELVLLVLDDSVGVTEEDLEIMEMCRGKELIALINKVDLNEGRVDRGEILRLLGDVPVVEISAETGEGLSSLEEAIVEEFRLGQVEVGREALITNVRHQSALRRGADHLAAALDAVRGAAPWDLVSIDLRGGWEALGEVTGETASDDLLDEIFSRFCIGK